MNKSQTERRIVEPIALDNFVLDGEAVRDSSSENQYLLAKSQQGWEEHFAGSGKRLPTLPEYVTIIAQLGKTNNPALSGILQDLRESMLCTGTKVDYGTSNFPVGNGYLDVLVKDSAWRTVLQDLLQRDVEEVVSVLHRTSGKRPYIWTPSTEGRISYPERAVWLGIDAGRFVLDCDINPIYSLGRARGVRVVGATGARAKKTRSVYRDQAMTEEERLNLRIEEELSRLDGFAGADSQERYAQIKQEVAQNLKGLYKK